ncbi:MAG TPA: class I SAM-dependent methyltransferase [Mycobacterium sp.]|nr:class I SAM-dependent methyltransferase [Mycobacterium sp.]
MVAAGRARATRANLIDDHLAEPLVRAVGVDFFTRWATGELAAVDVDVPGAFWGMQQMTDLLTARTRYFDGFLTEATNAGIRQVVILASGLDARGYRFAWPAGTVVFEIDQPEVLAFKAATLAELNTAPTAEVRTVGIDLRHDWPAALREAGFDTTKPCAWTAEGLLPFLPAEAQNRLLDNITALSIDGSRLASEVAVTRNGDGDQFWDSLEDVTKRWREHGFDVELGELGYSEERDDVADYLDGSGWHSVKTPLHTLLTEAGLPTMPVDRAFGDNYYCASVKGRQN